MRAVKYGPTAAWVLGLEVVMPNGEVRYVRVSAKAIKKGLVVKPPKRTWKKGETAAAKKA